ncbi:Uncharacterised protein [Candidatus Venteria ishoeyi]|uniref:Uncharacterized protein n=1 Tax=Candidatus Venteria ishoeyi TaxID=1899563 RepID=A0A1H6F8G9_9GAMM|nr:Uncharacterised protein [Candidatus Venteria ishoeyi]
MISPVITQASTLILARPQPQYKQFLYQQD